MASSSCSRSLKDISESLKQIESKKSNLKKAFEDLESQHSSLISSFSLSWPDLDSHFSSIQASLNLQFLDLQTLAPQDIPSPPVTPVPQPRPELVALCEAMDGVGLMKYLRQAGKERAAMMEELPAALGRSPDAAAMVVGAMEGFHGGGGEDSPAVSNLRRSCVAVLETMLAAGVGVGGEARTRAAGVAGEWWRRCRKDEGGMLECLGLLHLVAAFGLGDEFGDGELVDCVVVVAKYRQAVDLCRKVGLSHKVEDIVQKLLSKGKQLLAVKFCFEFGLTEKFPPVNLLKACVNEAKKTAKKVCKEGKNSLKAQNEATAKEVSVLRSVVKVIEERNLESEFPPESLEKRIEQLEKERVERKRPPSHSQRQQNGNKRSRFDGPSSHNSIPNSFRPVNLTIHSYPHSHLQPTVRSISGSAPYGISVPVPSSGMYGSTGTQTVVPGNNASVSSSSHLYTAESYRPTPSSYYDRGGYGLRPQYPPAYYPK